MITHKAPWGKTLIVMSTLVTVFCIGASAGAPLILRGGGGWSGVFLQWLPLVILLAMPPFVVRSYTITEDAILIQRLFWSTRLDRGLLVSAEIAPKVMNRSLRACGNGGGFSFTGWYWNSQLGLYRAFVTDLNRTVVLRFRLRSVVISPEDPEAFLADLGLDAPRKPVAPGAGSGGGG
jgi:hypothetical protein